MFAALNNFVLSSGQIVMINIFSKVELTLFIKEVLCEMLKVLHIITLCLSLGKLGYAENIFLQMN